MDHYIDIQIKPDAEMRENVLLNNVYTKLHKALFSLASINIGVSFPLHNVLLGKTLRIHSSKARIEELQNLAWLGGLAGYCSLSSIKPIPDTVGYRVMSRKQTTMSEAKLNRLLKRGSITEDKTKQYRAKMFTKGLNNPYVELTSATNGHKHRRYIKFGELVGKPVVGEFDQFGLSKTATVPWF